MLAPSLTRAVRYDDIYRMDEIKTLSFHMFYRLYHGVAKHIVNLYTPPTTGREGETEPGQNQELVTKRGTTSVAWSCVFKHCSFKTTDFKPLKLKQPSYMCAVSFCVRGARFLFSPTLNNYINTLIHVRIPVFASILVNSDLGLKRE